MLEKKPGFLLLLAYLVGDGDGHVAGGLGLDGLDLDLDIDWHGAEAFDDFLELGMKQVWLVVNV